LFSRRPASSLSPGILELAYSFLGGLVPNVKDLHIP
jgi:hypothetical protein